MNNKELLIKIDLIKKNLSELQDIHTDLYKYMFDNVNVDNSIIEKELFDSLENNLENIEADLNNNVVTCVNNEQL